ncbi:hypothetical protein M1146_06000 [Patescibacteria group bacterium]|nr:hypothetical protein [Patescibacteria group bacterium]
MTDDEIERLADRIAQRILVRLPVQTHSQHQCAWRMVMPYEKACGVPAQKQLKVASVSDGFPLDSDFKTIWLCEEHTQIIQQHNGFETREL